MTTTALDSEAGLPLNAGAIKKGFMLPTASAKSQERFVAFWLLLNMKHSPKKLPNELKNGHRI
jgi:hypothetical protein